MAAMAKPLVYAANRKQRNGRLRNGRRIETRTTDHHLMETDVMRKVILRYRWRYGDDDDEVSHNTSKWKAYECEKDQSFLNNYLSSTIKR